MGKVLEVKSSGKKFVPTVSYVHAQLAILATIKRNPTDKELQLRKESMQTIMRELKAQAPECGITDEDIDNFELGDEFKIV